MKELRSNVSFTQLRFFCSKQQGSTFHVTTAANSTGEAVVQYFSGQTDARPDACGSFVRMEDDNSAMAQVCKEWGVTLLISPLTNGVSTIRTMKSGCIITWFSSGTNIIGCFHQKVRDSNAMILTAKFRQAIFGRYMYVEDSINEIIAFVSHAKMKLYM